MSSRHQIITKLFCIVTIWGVLAWLFISPNNMTLQTLEDFLINEKYIEPKSKWKSTDAKNPLSSGRPSLMHSNVTFLGVGRNLGPRLPQVLQQIEMLSNEFSYSRAIFVEGGSTDETKDILTAWANYSPIKNRTFITMGGNDSFEESGHFKGFKLPREGRISNARNIGLQELYRLSRGGARTEYVIIVDLDVLGWDPYGVLDSFKKKDMWDVVCANGILLHGVYRDTYAFRTDDLNTNHHWAGNDEAMYNISTEEKKSFRTSLKASQSKTRTIMDFAGTNKMLKVTSCFGGLAIYRYASLEGCKYAFRHREPPYMLDCEHVLLHKCMIEKHQARIFSNSRMKLWYGHSPMATLTFGKIWKHFFT